MPSSMKPRDVEEALRELRPPLVDQPDLDRLAAILRDRRAAVEEPRPARRRGLPRRLLVAALIPAVAGVMLAAAILPSADHHRRGPVAVFLAGAR